MMPRTIHNLDCMVCISAMQKFIRRGMEREAMEFACELMHTSKALFSMAVNRLEVISHEDIGLADPQAVVFVATAVEQARRHYDAEKPGKHRLMVGNAIRILCRAKKSREGDHFQAVVGVANREQDKVPEVPDFVFDMHTLKGRRQGRGLEHFRKESARLMPPASDEYENEAYIIWKWKQENSARSTV